MAFRALLLFSVVGQAALSVLSAFPKAHSTSVLSDSSDTSEVHDSNFPRVDPAQRPLEFDLDMSDLRFMDVRRRGEDQVRHFAGRLIRKLLINGFKANLKNYFKSLDLGGCPITYVDSPSQIFQKYDFYGKALGQGSYGRVFYATSVNDRGKRRLPPVGEALPLSANEMRDTIHQSMPRQFAVKIQAPEEDIDFLHFANEVSVHWSLGGHGRNSHPNIAQLYEVFVADHFVVLVEEFVGGMSLQSLIDSEGRLTEDQARSLFIQLKAAVAHIHQAGAAHRDLKPDNIMLTETGMLKLIDFGFATWGTESPLNDGICGTATFVAPEMWKFGLAHKSFMKNQMTREELSRYVYSPQAADHWAMGVTLYYMLCGKLPFYSRRNFKILEMVERHRVATLDLPAFLASHVKTILKIYLNEDWISRLKMVSAGVPWPKESPVAYPLSSQAAGESVPSFQLQIADWGRHLPGLNTGSLRRTNSMPDMELLEYRDRKSCFDRKCFLGGIFSTLGSLYRATRRSP